MNTPPRIKDRTGQIFGEWTLKEFSHTKNYDTWNETYWKCECACGNISVIALRELKKGKSKSCGCLCDHGMNGTPTHSSWCSMKQRCLNTNAPSYPDYGGRGIKICDEWVDSFPTFLGDMGERPDGCTIDRRDNDGDYTPKNCGWSTVEEQANNKRTNRWLEYRGERKTLSQWARKLGIDKSTLAERLEKDWPLDKIFSSVNYRN